MKNTNRYTAAIKYDLEPVIEASENDEFVIEKMKGKYKVSTVNSHKGGIGVALGKDESVESLLKRFKKSVLESDVIRIYQERQVYVKPSIAKRLKKAHRQYRARLSSKNYY